MMRKLRGLGSRFKIFYPFNHLRRLIYLSSFQNGLSQLTTIISSNFINNNVRALDLNVKLAPIQESICLLIAPSPNYGAWVLGMTYFIRLNLFVRFSYLSRSHNGLNDPSIVIGSQFIIRNLETTIK